MWMLGTYKIKKWIVTAKKKGSPDALIPDGLFYAFWSGCDRDRDNNGCRSPTPEVITTPIFYLENR